MSSPEEITIRYGGNDSDKENPQNSFTSELEKLGVKAESMTAGEVEINSYELDLQSILNRWQIIFEDTIKNHHISQEQLIEWAQQFSNEARKIMDWIKAQPNPSRYRIYHFINPHTGEHLTIHHSGPNPKRVYGIFMRFDQQGGRLETDSKFSTE